MASKMTNCIQDIKTRREALGLSQAELCRRAGLTSSNYVCRLEGGKIAGPSHGTVVAIFDALEKAESEGRK
ncbi:helix-turn-helix domain-containing protein [Phaeobacter inhibens]|uniref:helix-turn-helix domain-containing protein n=1 Tax=Phaeobacter inhibens TaxID=221822 RepID=UPI000C99B776